MLLIPAAEKDAQLTWVKSATLHYVVVDNSTNTLLSIDLNHVCRAFNEHTGVSICCQAHQTCFLPQEHVSETYDVCASYMYLYS